MVYKKPFNYLPYTLMIKALDFFYQIYLFRVLGVCQINVTYFGPSQ